MGKHWKHEGPGPYANIYCPTLHNNEVDSFTVKKEIYREFFELENELKQKYVGWVSWTGLKNDHIMLFCAKAGAQPFSIDIKKKIIWFYKKF